MKKLIITTLLLLLTLVTLGYKWWQTDYKETTTTQKVQEEKHTIQVKNSSNTTPITTIEEQIKTVTPNNSHFDMQETGEETTDIIEESVSTISPFTEESIDDMKLETQPLQGIDPIAAISMEKNSITHSKIGDTILLPSIEGSNYEMIVKDKSTSATGNVSIHGDYMENGITYHSILTEGKGASFISMTTPTGTYEINLIQGKGYIYASSEIENKKIDYTKSDTMTVSHEEDKERLE